MKRIQKNTTFAKKRNNLTSIAFARAICCLGIITFHYSCHSKKHPRLFYTTSNASCGFIYVTCFFSISGIVLYYNYPNNISIKKFYFKRWKSIFPAYYLCFLYFYQNNVFKYKKLFYHGNWKKLVLTLFGIDGYLSYKYNTYYLIGEWFTGAIVIIYYFYPIIVYIFNKNKFLIPIFLFFGFVIMIKTKYFEIFYYMNLITCISSFYFGIVFIKYKNFFLNKIVIYISFFINIFLYFKSIYSKFPSFKYQIYQLQGFTFLIILIYLGKIIMNSRLKSLFNEISRLSYFIFLFHHITIMKVFSLNNPMIWYKIIFILVVIILLSIIYSKVLQTIIESIYKSRAYISIESYFVKN